MINWPAGDICDNLPPQFAARTAAHSDQAFDIPA